MRSIDAGLINRDTVGSSVVVILLLLISLAVTAFFANPNYILNQLFFIALFGFVATAWNLISGYAGQVSLGHAVFFGIGAYTSTVLWNDLAITPWIGMIIGGFIAGAFALLIGYATFQRSISGHYFALFTIGVVAAVHVILLEITQFSLFGVTFHVEAASGLTLDIPSGSGFVTNLYALQFLNQMMYVVVMTLMLAVLVLFSAVLSRSRIGYWMRAIRDDEDAAEALGVEAFRIKMFALFVSAFFTAVGGTMFAQQQTYIHPNSVATVVLSVQIAVFAIIGGMDYPYGPIVGAATIYTLATILQSNVETLVNVVQIIPLITLNQSWVAASINTFTYGMALILVILFLDQGVAGSLTDWYVRRVKGKTASGAGTTVSQRSD